MSAADTALLVIDVQEKLLPKLPDAAALTRNIAFLIDAARLLDMLVCRPRSSTSRGPAHHRSPELAQGCRSGRTRSRSARARAPRPWSSRFHREARPKVVLAGIETHVCVLHTALDLLADDFRVFIAVDARGARYRIDPLRRRALRRRRGSAGAVKHHDGRLRL